MPLVDIESEAFVAASAVFGSKLAEGTWTVFASAADVLSGCGAMAGWDSTGQSWADAYDPAVEAVTTATQDVVNGSYRLGALLSATGFNHGAAEDASVPGGVVRQTVDWADYDESVMLSSPPLAAGGSGSPPPGWSLVEHLLGAAWPNGHQDRLHTAADAWGVGAGGLTDLASLVPSAVSLIEQQQSPEVEPAALACLAMGGHLRDLAAEYHALGHACFDYATDLDKTHAEIIAELNLLIEQSVAIQVGGAILAFFTAGASEIAAQVAETARVALAATRIIRVLNDLRDSLLPVLGTISAITTRVGEITTKVRTLLATRVIRLSPKAAQIVGASSRVRPAAQAGATVSQGLHQDGALAATVGLRNNGGHAMRYLIEAGLMPNAGRLEDRLYTFQKIVTPVLQYPDKTFEWRLGGTTCEAYAGYHNGERLVVFVAKEGPWAGKVLSAFTPNPANIAKWGL